MVLPTTLDIRCGVKSCCTLFSYCEYRPPYAFFASPIPGNRERKCADTTGHECVVSLFWPTLYIVYMPLVWWMRSSAVDTAASTMQLGWITGHTERCKSTYGRLLEEGTFPPWTLSSGIFYLPFCTLPEATRALVHAFVSCRLDYCNSLLADVHLRLQSVQNAAARLVSGACRRDRIKPFLATLHWLPVRQRVIVKTPVLVWKCLYNAAPRYLADLCGRASPVSLSAVSGALLVPWTRTFTGQRSCLRMAPGPGTDYQRPSDHQNCRSLYSSASSRPTCLFQH